MKKASFALVGLGLILLGCPKGKTPEAAIVGWHNANPEVWAAECYYPPAYEEMGPGDRRVVRQKVMEAMMSQWQGNKDSVVSFNGDHVTTMETVLLGQPDDIERVSIDNLDRCKGAMESGQTTAWAKWLRDAPAALTEGQCNHPPLDYRLFDYLDIGREWQINAKICEGNQVRIKGSTLDYYRLEDNGKWITVDGDLEQPAIGADLPCNMEGCYLGQLIMRFRGESGMEQVIPIGAERMFTAPEHGSIDVMINERGSWFDNKYKIEGSIEHHASIEYAGDL